MKLKLKYLEVLECTHCIPARVIVAVGSRDLDSRMGHVKPRPRGRSRFKNASGGQSWRDLRGMPHDRQLAEIGGSHWSRGPLPYQTSDMVGASKSTWRGSSLPVNYHGKEAGSPPLPGTKKLGPTPNCFPSVVEGISTRSFRALLRSNPPRPHSHPPPSSTSLPSTPPSSTAHATHRHHRRLVVPTPARVSGFRVLVVSFIQFWSTSCRSIILHLGIVIWVLYSLRTWLML
jgi:hypothetical protein